MAIDKSRSPLWVKVIVILVAISFVLVVGVPFLGTILSPTTSTTGTGTGTTGSASTTDTLSAISKQFAPQTEAIDKQLATDPKNPELLKAQAEQYYSWAGAILTATNSLTEARPMAALAVQYYDRAFAAKPGDSADLTDYAAALFYSGDLARATSTAEGVVAKDAKFAAAWFNLGVFYGAAGRNADAIKAYQSALAIEPNGPDAAELKSRIAQLQQQPAPSPSASPTP
jgi:tetratricopeptide (TPR) repeat protein